MNYQNQEETFDMPKANTKQGFLVPPEPSQ